MAGETYAKRYGGGFSDSGQATPADSQFLNAVETALIRLLGEDPATDEVPIWDPAISRFKFQKIQNIQIHSAAAIDKSKLNLAGQIVDADISGSAAISKSKLAPLGIVDADVAVGAAIQASKISGLSVAQRKVTAKTVASTITATDLLNDEIAIAAGALGSNKAVRLVAWGHWKNESGSTVAPPRLQLEFGGTVQLDTGTSGNFISSATLMGWDLEVIIQNVTSSTQIIRFNLIFNSSTFNAAITNNLTTGSGQYAGGVSGGANATAIGHGTGIIDTLAQQNLKLKVINGANHASYLTHLVGGLVEIL